MKKIIFNIIILAFCGLTTSCNDFLTNKDQDKIIPKNANHFKELIYGELIRSWNDVDYMSVMDLMTDDVTSYYNTNNGSEDVREADYGYFGWQQEVEFDFKGDPNNDTFYSSLYNKILLCNSIEALLTDVTDNPDMVYQLYGEIYFIRAYCYYMLANVYGYPYVDGSELCVPLNVATGIDNQIYTRVSTRTIYDRIESDIELAVLNFSQTKQQQIKFRPNLEATYILATRVYITERKYAEVIKFADKLEYGDLYDLSAHKSAHGTVLDINANPKYVTFFCADNSELAFTFGNYSTYGFTQATHKACYTRSAELNSLYTPGDLRREMFFDAKGNPIKTSNFYNGAFGMNMRLSEALLNRAEAKLMLGNDTGGATADLNLLRSRRFDGSQTPLAAVSIDDINDEYRREFCFEGLRWFHLRRIGQPKIEHRYYTGNVDFVTFTLAQGDKAYTMELPKLIRDRNPNIERIERPARTAK